MEYYEKLTDQHFKTHWPTVATSPKDTYLCSKISDKMDDEKIALKPFMKEELLEMAETGRKQIAEGKHFTTEEVLQYCGYNIDSKVL